MFHASRPEPPTRPAADGQYPTRASPCGAGDGTGTEPDTSDGGDSAGSDGAAGAFVDENGVTKSFTLTGADAALLAGLDGGVAVHEQINPELFQARVGQELRTPNEDQLVEIPLGDDRTATYRLQLADGANIGRGTTSQTSHLLVGHRRQPIDLAGGPGRRSGSHR